MNWLDLAIIGTMAGCAIAGVRIGLLGAAVTAAGGLVGWLLAGMFGGDIASLLVRLPLSPAWANVVSYALIIGLALILAGMIRGAALPALSAVTLGISGLLDRVGGLAMGVVVGVVVSSIMVIAVSGFERNLQGPVNGTAWKIMRQIPGAAEAGDSMNEALETSATAPYLIELSERLPRVY